MNRATVGSMTTDDFLEYLRQLAAEQNACRQFVDQIDSLFYLRGLEEDYTDMSEKLYDIESERDALKEALQDLMTPGTDMCTMAMHAPLDECDGLDQSNIDDALQKLVTARQLLKDLG